MISGIQQNAKVSLPEGPAAFTHVDDRAALAQKNTTPRADVVSVHQPSLMSDEEASSAIMQIGNSLREDSSIGLSIHDSLDVNKVALLLEGL